MYLGSITQGTSIANAKGRELLDATRLFGGSMFDTNTSDFAPSRVDEVAVSSARSVAMTFIASQIVGMNGSGFQEMIQADPTTFTSLGEMSFDELVTPAIVKRVLKCITPSCSPVQQLLDKKHESERLANAEPDNRKILLDSCLQRDAAEFMQNVEKLVQGRWNINGLLTLVTDLTN